MGLRTSVMAIACLSLVAGVVPAAAQAPEDRGAEQAPGTYQGWGDPGGFHNLAPAGQDGVLNVVEIAKAQATGETPEHFDDQLELYAGLIRDDVTPGFTADDLDTWFKDASFGVRKTDVARTYSPGGRDDVTVIRDESFGVPHIYGQTREAAQFANGYTAAEDRLFLMDVLRHVGRAELSSFLGASAGNRAMDADQMAAAPYTEADLQRQIEAMRTSDDPWLQQVYADGQAYIEGVNQYIGEALTDPTKLPGEYPALQVVPEKFVPADIVAIASLVGGIFGKGGGREVANWCGLRQMEAELGAERARAVFDDLKFADDPEAPVTARDGTFPYMADLGPTDPATVPELDCDSLEPIEAPDPSPTTVDPVEIVPTPPMPQPPGATPGTGLLGEVSGGSVSTPAEAPTVDLPGGEQMVLDLDMGMSNALLVNGDRTDSGRPIAVFGPQTGYFAPQLLVEKDIHAPGLSARGVAFAGTDIYVQLGRGRDYAWSATSASADIVDQWVLELCEPGGGEPTTDSMGYRHVERGSEPGDATCRAIEAYTETMPAKPSAGGVPESPEDLVIVKHFERAPDYGPLTARGTLEDGTPVAVAVQRTTYGSELRSAKGFAQVNDPTFMTDGVDSFRQAMGDGIDYTFNWFYVDGTDVAYQHSCRCPQRAQGTDPYLPTWGTGAYDWVDDDSLGLDDQPHTVSPSDGYITSWNNKQADGFRTNDGDFSKASLYRSLLLDRRLEGELAEGDVDLGEAVDVMALAATTDLRAQENLPVLAEVMGATAPDDLDPRTQPMWELMRDWAADDLGHRRDHDGDGSYEHAQAIAIMDAWWPLLYDAIFEQGTADARRKLGYGIHDAPQGHQGSAFNGGAYGHVDKDLRQVLGEDVAAPLSTTYCGGGDLAACRDALWQSLSDAAADLEAEFGSAEVADWQRVPADDAIVASTVGVQGIPDIDWQNRPTFQQVVQLPPADDGGEGPGRGNGKGNGPPDHAGPPDDPGNGNGGPPDDAGPPESTGPGRDGARVEAGSATPASAPAQRRLPVGLATVLLGVALAATTFVRVRRRPD